MKIKFGKNNGEDIIERAEAVVCPFCSNVFNIVAVRRCPYCQAGFLVNPQQSGEWPILLKALGVESSYKKAIKLVTGLDPLEKFSKVVFVRLE